MLVPYASPSYDPPPRGAAAVSVCPNHHYRASGYCPHCREYVNPARRQVMNPPARAEAGNLANTAPLPADHEAQRRGLDKRVFVAGGRQPITATAERSHD